MATAAKIPAKPAKPRVTKKKPVLNDIVFRYTAINRERRSVSGEVSASSQSVALSTLRRQGYTDIRLKKAKRKRGKKITQKDVCVFTRQLATMMRAGVPMLQSFEIVAQGHNNPRMGALLMEVKSDIESGTSLSQALSRHPLYFDTLYCNLVTAGEAAGILEDVLDRLAVYLEKIVAIKAKIKSALFYPTAVIIVAFIVVTVIMIFVIPAFKDIFSSFGANLPAPTLIVIAMSDFFVENWFFIFGGTFGIIWFFFYTWKRSIKMQMFLDRLFLKLPIFGELLKKSAIARWTRTLSTMFAAGVPLVEALDSVGGAAGNIVYKQATDGIRDEVATGISLTAAMINSYIFPNMVTQMTAIGEESGALDDMLGKVADFYEDEVDNMVAALSSLMEPIIMVVLGVIIGGLVIAMYLPIFKLGSVI